VITSTLMRDTTSDSTTDFSGYSGPSFGASVLSWPFYGVSLVTSRSCFALSIALLHEHRQRRGHRSNIIQRIVGTKQDNLYAQVKSIATNLSGMSVLANLPVRAARQQSICRSI
jgi:hypothetical protein